MSEFNNQSSQVETEFRTISDEDFNLLMGEDSPGTLGPNDVVGSQPQEEKGKKVKKVTTTITPVNRGEEGDKVVQTTEEDEEDEEYEDTSEIETAPADEINDALGEETEEDEINDSEDDDNNTGSVDIASFLKAKADGLIERGVWVPWEDMEEYEWTEESYGEMAALQANHQAERKFNEMLEQTGDYGKIIFEHIQNGGNPEEILGLLKQSREVNSFDITNDQGRESLIKEYYTKVMNWSEARVTKYVKMLVDNEELESEATDVKALMDTHIQNQIAEKQEAQKKWKQEREKAEQAWISTISSTIKSREDLTEKEKREIQKDLLEYTEKLPDGRVVNKFTTAFMELQRDPNQYIDLVLFVQNPKKYKEKVSKKAEIKTEKKNWNLLKGNRALSTNKTGTSHQRLDNGKSKGEFKIDYKQINL